VLLTGFQERKAEAAHGGKTPGEVARIRHTNPEDAAMDLVIEDDSRVSTVYFLMSEEMSGVRSCCRGELRSDEDTRGIDGVFLKSSAHPRAYAISPASSNRNTPPGD